jgi:glycine/D-amino acid oxidase-like deaminating enzyme
MGIDSRLVEKEEVKRLEPFLDVSDFDSVVYEPNMGYAEPSTTASSFAAAAESMGANVLADTSLLHVTRTPEGYSISTSRGEISARKVVFATGVWSGPIFQSLGIELPIKPVRHPVAIFRRPQNFSGVRPTVFDFCRSAYYKAEGQNLLFVGSMEAELDAKSLAVDPDRYDEGISFEEVSKYSEWTAQIYPLMGSSGEYERGYSGVYDNTPDQQPIIDELGEYGLPGAFCLVGLSGHGFKLCPEFGRLMASLVTEDEFRDYDVSIFKLKRFAEGRLLKGRYGLSTVG